MTNIKKIIIFVLVLFLILIFRRKRLFENFFDEKYLDSNYLSKDTLHTGDVTNIYIEFFYKDSCSISRQFLYGCCKPYNEKDKELNELKDDDFYLIEKSI